MDRANRWIRTASTLLVAAGLALLGANIAFGGKINFTLPLVFLMLGAAFFALVFVFAPRWAWAAALLIPGSVFGVLGLIFLLNVITNDWNSWAYAWLLVVAGLGLGVVLAARRLSWRQEITLGGAVLIVLGVTFFALFGAIAGGPVIWVMAPLLLALSGLLLRWLRLETFLPASVLKRFPPAAPQPSDAPLASSPAAKGLIEPLSVRELEVLQAIDRGLSNQEIAEDLSLALSTVKTHINNIYGKLGVQTRVQAVKRARELDLIH
jgi:DNA-binding CsgD family transcriptional regulator